MAIRPKISRLISTYPLEHNILFIFLLFGFGMGLSATVVNLGLGLPPVSVWPPLFIGLVCVLLFFVLYARPGLFMPIAIINFIITGLLFPFVGYFSNSGSFGGFQYFLIVITAMHVMIFPGRSKYLVLFLMLLLITGLFTLEQLYPALIVPYVSESDRFPDVLFSILVSTAVVSSLFLVAKNRFENDREKVTGYSKKLREKNKELIKAKEEAEQAVVAKEQFLSTMSHEIRTPLNAVVGISSLMSAQRCSPEQAENLDILKFSSENLLSLINDVLDYNKMESGKLELEEVSFSLKGLLDMLYKTYKPKADENGLKLIVDYEGKLPGQIVGDPVRISQVLSNLISNAIKFTPKGEVNVQLKENERCPPRVLIGFRVADTGIGIPPEKHERVFEEFAQADSGTSRRFGGTGLGLAIVKRLVILMGGGIHLESQQGQGAVFSFSLPFYYKEKDVRVGLGQTATVGSGNLAGKKILIVEDNPMNVLVVKKHLNNWQASPDVATNGKEAVDMCAKTDYDLILMDIQMPVMDGYRASRHIRGSKGKNARVPIIALTASVMYEVRRKVSESGMNDYVAKPFNVEELYTKIIKHTT